MAYAGKGNYLVAEVDFDMAEHLGFSVIEAGDGLEAVEIFRLRHDEIALVLIDHSMPRLSGQEAFRAIRNIDSAIPVVLSSGYDVPEKDMFVEGLAGLLKKPFRVAEFQGLLQRALAPLA